MKFFRRSLPRRPPMASSRSNCETELHDSRAERKSRTVSNDALISLSPVRLGFERCRTRGPFRAVLRRMPKRRDSLAERSQFELSGDFVRRDAKVPYEKSKLRESGQTAARSRRPTYLQGTFGSRNAAHVQLLAKLLEFSQLQGLRNGAQSFRTGGRLLFTDP